MGQNSVGTELGGDPPHPSPDPCVEGWVFPQPPHHGQRRIPSGHTHGPPQRRQRPPEKAPAGNVQPPPKAFVKKEGFFRKRKRKTRTPSTTTTTTTPAATPWRDPPLARLTTRPRLSSPRTPPWWLCTPAPSPRTPATVPPARRGTLTSGTEACRGALAGSGGHRRARCVLVAVRSSLVCGSSSRRDVTAREPSSPRLP